MYNISTNDATISKVTKDKGVGWKVLRMVDGGLQAPIFNHVNGSMKVNKWHRANGGTIGAFLGTYERGFHIFLTKKAANKYKAGLHADIGLVVRKVKYRKATAVGYQGDSGLAVCAKEMLIVPVRKMVKV